MSKSPLYAIVDIETTGGRAVRDKITEIGIVLFDGTKIVEQYQSLINPECPIPYGITQLTGITQDMVAGAPTFPEVARRIVEMTESAIFVAHNVRFDYSFLRAEFARLGYTYTRKTLCTVRMSRLTFPGLRSYSLGNLIRHFNIQTKDRHRALADALATTELLQYIQQAQDNGSASLEWVQLGLKESLLPQGLSLELIQELPERCGVYYFQDRAGDVVYIGKSINIRKRIVEHFRDKTEKARKLQQMVHSVHYEETGSELIALLLESYEIKRVQPPINKAQRMRNYPYVIHQYTNNQGILCLESAQVTAAQRKKLQLVSEHPTLSRTKSALMGVVDKYKLCHRYCGLEKTEGPCFHFHIRQCQGICAGHESAERYNQRAEDAVERLSTVLEGSFFLLDKGRNESERSVVFVEDGIYQGYGFIDQNTSNHLDDLRNSIRYQPDNAEIRRLIKHYQEEHPTILKIPAT